MSHYNVKPIQATLQLSRLLMAALSCMHVLCLLLVLLMPLEIVLRVGLLILLLLSWAACWWREFYQVRFSALHVDADGAFTVCGRDGAWLKAEVLGSSLVTPWFTVLHLRFENRRLMQTVLMLPDMLDGKTFRRLRVWLRWGKHTQADHENS